MNCNDTLSSQIALLNEADDGIRLNEKLSNVLHVLEATCINLQQLREAFAELADRCLSSPDFSVNVSMFISSPMFATREMFGLRLRNLLFYHLQNHFELAANWLTSDEDKFYNAMKLISEVYKRARLLDGKPIPFLPPAIIKYMHILLKALTPRGARELSAQLSFYGPMLMRTDAPLVEDLMMRVRKALIHSTDNVVSFWLMLAIDLSSSCFDTINKDLETFYASMCNNQSA